MKKNLLKTKLVLLMALLCTGLSSAWGQISTWTATNGTYTSGQQITGSVEGLLTMTLGTDDGWVYDSGRSGIVTRTQQSPTIENGVPTAGGYVVISPSKDIHLSLRTYSSQSNCNVYMYDSEGNKLKDFRQKAYNTNDYGKLKAGGTYYIYGGSFKEAGTDSNLEYVFFQNFTAATYTTYTIKYVFGEQVLATDADVEGYLGEEVSPKASIMVGEGAAAVKYVPSDATLKLKIEGETPVFEVPVIVAKEANAVVNAVDADNNILKTFTVKSYEGETVDVFITRAVLYNGNYYTVAAANGNIKNYAKSAVCGGDAVNVTYTLDNTISLYAEVEDINKSKAFAAEGNAPERASGGHWWRLIKSSYVYSEPLEAGIYTVEVSGRNQGKNQESLGVKLLSNQTLSEDALSTLSWASSANVVNSAENIAVPEGAAIAICNVDESYNSNIGLDYIILRKTGEYTPEPVDPQPVEVGFPGATDKTSKFSQSDNYQLQMGKKVTFAFKNYGYGTKPDPDGGVFSWHNWTIGVYTGQTCHAFTRADFWDNIMNATTGYLAMSTDGGTTIIGVDWNDFEADMIAGADVNMVVTYNTDGTLTINAVSTGESGNLYYVNRTVEGMTANSVDLRLGIEYSYITDLTATFEDIPEEPVIVDEGDYEITISESEEGGELLSNRTKANAGEDITFTAKPAQGYKLKEVLIEKTTAEDPDGATVEFSRRGATTEEPTLVLGDAVVIPATQFVDGKFTFKMYACDIIAKAVFEKDETPTPQPTTYSVTIISTDANGSVTANPTTAKAGETIVLTITPNQGYELDKLKINNVEVTVTGNTYTTTMPEGGLTVYPTFKQIEVPVQKAKLTLNTEWTTFYSPITMELADGVEAYTVSEVILPEAEGVTGTVQLVKRNYIAKNVPMILHNTALATAGTKTFELVINENAETGIAPNTLGAVFKGTSEDIQVEKNDVYVLKNGKFVLYSGTSIKKYNCYIDFPYEPAGATRSLNFEVVGGETTGIKAVNRVAVEGQVYDLQGRQVNSAVKKGIYVIDGKKVVIK